MKILGLVGSYRKNGNSEILVKEALDQCRNMGARVALLRLTDLTIKPCLGCLKCLNTEEECSLDDDLYFLINQIMESDGIVLGYPTYLFNLPGILKMIQDRSPAIIKKMVNSQLEKRKKGLVLVSGGLNKLGCALPLGECFLETILIDNVGSIEFTNCYGPGTSMLDNEAKILDLKSKTHDLLESIKNNTANISDKCPFCSRKIIQLKEQNLVECILCKKKGQLSGKSIKWDNDQNITKPDIFSFYTSKHSESQQKKFFENRKRIYPLVNKYKDKNCNIRWIKINNHH